jgi:hypothetical protein
VLITASVDGDLSEYESAVRESGADPLRVDAGDPDLRVLDRVQGLMSDAAASTSTPRHTADRPTIPSRQNPQRDAFEFDLVRAARANARCRRSRFAAAYRWRTWLSAAR